MATDAGIAERIEITSNGSALTEEKVKRLIGSGLAYLRVSIYSVYQERNQQITQTKLSVDRIRQNLMTFRRLRDEAGAKLPYLYIKMIDTYTSENEAFREMYTPIGDEVSVEPPMDWNSFDDRNLMGRLYEGMALAKIRPVSGPEKRVCPFLFYSLVIKANGDVVACCVDWNKQTKVGNVRENTFPDIWFGEPLREFRRIHIEGRREENPSCRNCTHLHTLPDNIDHLSEERCQEILKPGREQNSPVDSSHDTGRRQ